MFATIVNTTLYRKKSSSKFIIELCEKRIREFTADQKAKNEELADATERLKERQVDLEQKKGELDEIIADTRQQEEGVA